jgi:hypothetical protein
MNLKSSKSLLVCTLAFLSLSVPSGLAADRPAELKIVDVMPTFWQYWQRAEGKPQSEQIALFRDVSPPSVSGATYTQHPRDGAGRRIQRGLGSTDQQVGCRRSEALPQDETI